MEYHIPKMTCLGKPVIAIQSAKRFCPRWLDSEQLPYITVAAYEAAE